MKNAFWQTHMMAALLSWLPIGAHSQTPPAKYPPWTGAPVPLQQVLVYAARGTVTADTAEGKARPINFDLGEARSRTGIGVVGERASISTTAGATTSIVIPTAGTAKLGAETEVRLPPKPDPKPATLQNSSDDRMNHSLELLKGQLFLNIDPEQVKQRGPATFRLKTPSALLAVKGTQFFSETSAQGDLVGVHEGSLSVYHPATGDSITLTAGQVVTVTSTEISKPRRLSPDEKKLNVNYAEVRLRREPLKAEWLQPVPAFGKSTKSFHPENKLGTEYQFAIDAAAYNQNPAAQVAPDLKLDVSHVKRRAVALELVVRTWNIPYVTLTNPAFSASLKPEQAAQQRFSYLPFKGTSNGAPRPLENREWTMVVPLERSLADKLPTPFALKCEIIAEIRKLDLKPDKQPVIEITGLTLITEDQ